MKEKIQRIFDDKIANSACCLNEILLSVKDAVKNDDSAPAMAQEITTVTYVRVRSENGTITDASADLVEKVVLLTIAELAGSKDVAMHFVSSFTEPLKTFGDYFSP